MKQGTWSVLLGCHSPVHSIIVTVAWVKLYRSFPAPWELVCIFIHDIGHWGKDYLNDYEEKKRHGIAGTKLAQRLFGEKGHDLCAGHNEYNGAKRSRLYDPDKYSWVIAPIWWLMSNQIFEPKLIRKNAGRYESAVMFKQAMAENMKTGFKEAGHAIYLRQWGHQQNDRSKRRFLP